MNRIFGICAVLVFAATTASAADEIASGRDFAERWCTGCHVVGPGIRGGTVGPGFEEIARKSGRTRENLTNWMVAPHPPMPDLEVTPAQASGVAAYILSLQ